MLVGNYLAQLEEKRKTAFFLHIPFPPWDLFMRLPWRTAIIESLLHYDLVGFQTERDRWNFIRCVRRLFANARVSGPQRLQLIEHNGRVTRVGAFPISIDFQEFADLAATDDVASRAWYIHEQLPEVQIILGIDRLDYTKGIIERLRAFRIALLRYPELREKVVLVEVVVPSRREIPEYQGLKIEIERVVGDINGQFTRGSWVPIHYQFRSLDRTELVAYYRTAEIALLTPFKDGMNLIAKEYCAASLEEDGCLILSEFAGAAAQLQKGALLVNPHDTEGVADAIYQAFKMSQDERRERMKKLRAFIRKQDIYWWVNSFLQAAIERRLDNFPVIEDYLPQIDLP